MSMGALQRTGRSAEAQAAAMHGHPDEPLPGIHGWQGPDSTPQVNPACLRPAPHVQEAQPAAAAAARRVAGNHDMLRQETHF